MARTAFNKYLSDTTPPYTVPPGKYLICAAHGGDMFGVVYLDANEQHVLAIKNAWDGGKGAGPLVFKGGDLIEVVAPGGTSYGSIYLTGFLYDE